MALEQSACTVLVNLFLGSRDDGPDAFLWQALAAKLIRMQVLQCASRKLSAVAAFAERLRSCQLEPQIGQPLAAGSSALADFHSTCRTACCWIELAGTLVAFAAAEHELGTASAPPSPNASLTGITGGAASSGSTEYGANPDPAAGGQPTPGRQLTAQGSRRHDAARGSAAPAAAAGACCHGLARQVEVAMAGSAVMEHAARTLLLLTEVAWQTTPDGLEGIPEHGVEEQAMHGRRYSTPGALGADELECVRSMLGRTRRILLQMLSETWDERGSPIHLAASGPCATHMALAQGVAVLRLGDGGSAGGLPGSLLEGLQRLSVPGEINAVPIASGTQRLHMVATRLVIPLLYVLGDSFFESPHPSTTMSPPQSSASAGAVVALLGRRSVVSLLLRVADWAVNSALLADATDNLHEGWTGEEQGQDWPQQEQQEQRQQTQASTRNTLLGNDLGDDLGDEQAIHPGDVGILLPPRSVSTFAVRALQVARPLLLPPLTTAASAGRMAAEARWWELGILAAMHCMRESPPGCAAALGFLLRFGFEVPGLEGGALPPAPPPAIAAALQGGLLEGLERLLRAAGANPTGPYIQVLLYALTSDRRDTWRQLAPLLAYGEPRRAASLLVTIGKLLRIGLAEKAQERKENMRRASGAAPQLLETASTSNGLAPVVHFAASLLIKGREWLASAAFQQARMADQPAPTRQLAQMLSLAVCTWVPELSRAAVFKDGAGSAAQQHDVYVVDHCAWVPLMHWLPVLARAAGAAAAGAAGPSLPVTSSTAPENTHGAAAAAASAPAVAPSTASAGAVTAAAGSASCVGEWHTLLTDESHAIALLGAALASVPSLGAIMVAGGPFGECLPHLADSCCALAALCPAEARQAAVEAHAAPGTAVRQVAPGRPDRLLVSRTLTEVAARKGLIPNMRILAGCVPDVDDPSGPVWPPEGARVLALDLRARGLGAASARAEALATQLQRWGKGADTAGERRRALAARLGVTEQDSALDAVVLALTPPAAARRLLRTCANPACINVSGDSEAALPLQACSRCGVAWYCGRECQVAHWTAGHKVACSRVRQASA